jgi:hypothetical protein
MRPAPNALIEPFRVRVPGRPALPGTNNGDFAFRHKDNWLCVVASDGGGWDHVSVSLVDRCPTWEEMCYIASLFFTDQEWLIQYRPEERQYINCHPHCLHWWRPQGIELPHPPAWMVGPKKGVK